MRFVVGSPVGPLGVVVRDSAVTDVKFGVAPGDAGDHLAAAELGAYFAGTLTDFTVPVAVTRGSEFERSVWAEIAAIPYGKMRTYGDIAVALGGPGLARAVGTACSHNPTPVIVPCHRVVGAGGRMVGFGGGLERKRILLELEARVSFLSGFGG